MKSKKLHKKDQMLITSSNYAQCQKKQNNLQQKSSHDYGTSTSAFSRNSGLNTNKQLNFSSAALKVLFLTSVSLLPIMLIHHEVGGDWIASVKTEWLVNGIKKFVEHLDFTKPLAWHNKELVKHLEWHDNVQHVVVFDAGSTGTRLHVYLFTPMKDGRGVEMVSEVFQKISPGISNYAHNPGAVAVQLQSLVDAAMRAVPGALHVVTPLIFKATAGLRLLAPETQSSLLKSVRELLLSSTNFVFNPLDVNVMNGVDEGLFGWITINFLLGNLQQDKKTVAAIDCGGGSLQVTYRVQPEDFSSLEDVEQVQIFDLDYSLYTHSYLGQGLKSARIALLHAVPDGSFLSYCLPAGYLGKLVYDDDTEFIVKGPETSVPEGCWEQVDDFVKKSGFLPQPSLMKGDIYLFAFFFDVARDAGLIGQDQHEVTLTSQDYLDASKRVCGAPEQSNPFLCQDLTYIALMLHNGLKLWDKELHVVDQLNGGETSWTLGVALAAVSNRQSPA